MVRRDPRFDDPLVLTYIDGHNWRVDGAFDYHSDVRPGWVINVPDGFITDFASVPRALWGLYSPTGTYGKAAVVHDYLYRTYGLATKAEADAVFLEAMEYLGTGWWTRHTLYQAVHWFGRQSYKGGI